MFYQFVTEAEPSLIGGPELAALPVQHEPDGPRREGPAIHESKLKFLEYTRLDRLRPEPEIEATLLGGYERMLEHINVHRYFMGLDFKREVSEEEAVGHWYDDVYLPVIRVIRKSGLPGAFPGKTEADFYLWVMNHRRALVEQGRAELVEPEQTAEEFVREYT